MRKDVIYIMVGNMIIDDGGREGERMKERELHIGI